MKRTWLLSGQRSHIQIVYLPKQGLLSTLRRKHANSNLKVNLKDAENKK